MTVEWILEAVVIAESWGGLAVKHALPPLKAARFNCPDGVSELDVH